MESLSLQVDAAAKLLILNPNEFDLVFDGIVQAIAPTTAEQRLAKKNELKARGTLLMALPDKHQLKFNIYKDVKSLMEAIEKRNKADLEDQSLDDLFNNLKIYEAEVKSSSSTSHTTQNIAFVSSNNTDSTNESVSAVPSVSAASTKTPISILPNVDNLSDAVIYSFFAIQSNSPQLDNEDLKQIDVDDLEEMDLKCYDWSFQADEEPTNYALMAFTSSSSSSSFSSDNEVALCSKAFSKAYATLQSHYDKLTVDFRKSQFDVLSYKSGLEYVKARLVFYQQNKNVFEEDIKLLKLDVMLRDNTLVELRKKLEKAKKEIDELKQTLEKFQTSLKYLSKLLENQITDKTGLGYDNQVFLSHVFACDELTSSESDVSMSTSPVHDRCKSCEGYHVVPPSYTGIFLPLKPDLIFHDAFTVSETVPNVFNVKPSTTKPTKEMSQSDRPFALIIKDWVSDSDDDSKGEPMPTQKEPNFVQTFEHVKTPRTSVKPKVVAQEMTGNISYLSDLEEINGGYVAFGGNIKGGMITSKGKIKIGKLDFDDVYFVKELKFNLFSVSQMCDKKNSVLFTDTECVVLSSDFLWDKGIKREFSIARTPQQIRVVERKNKTLIEADRTMLADSLLPIPFWAEVVNIACNVQNRVLVTKSYNKTPYELLLGRTPSIGFMRPFGCLVTILNTLDPLGEFDGKADEGFLVGYSVNNPQNTDADAAFDVKDNENEVHVSPRVRDLSDEFKEFSVNSTNRVNAASAPVTAVGPNPTNSTNSFNASNMPALEDIIYSDDEEDVSAEADFSNLETSITVSPISTTRVHKDHPASQIICDLTSTP
nr:retrovirus-related Pol polyprotein from transposon TNT 1-94 [Tanacetum cinerariifolium]